MYIQEDSTRDEQVGFSMFIELLFKQQSCISLETSCVNNFKLGWSSFHTPENFEQAICIFSWCENSNYEPKSAFPLTESSPSIKANRKSLSSNEFHYFLFVVDLTDLQLPHICETDKWNNLNFVKKKIELYNVTLIFVKLKSSNVVTENSPQPGEIKEPYFGRRVAKLAGEPCLGLEIHPSAATGTRRGWGRGGSGAGT